ncbi:MAG: sensor histidine kinase, partial [Bacteroidota bacterium]
ELLTNALKFGDKPVVEVLIRTSREDNGRLLFQVSDNGPGIPHEHYDHVFEDFFQVEEHVTGQVPGWGVGLRMVREIVQAYGGLISVNSRLGEGSLFTFTLPSAASDGAVEAPVNAKQEAVTV